MRLYELVLILKSSLSEDQRKKLQETIKGWLKDVKIASEEEWGKKNLSFPIKRETNGYYKLLALETESSIPSDFEKRLFGQDNILRHLLIRRK